MPGFHVGFSSQFQRFIDRGVRGEQLAYMNTEMDAIAIRYASSIQEQAKTAQAAMIRAEGASRSSAIKTQAYANLLEAGAKTATMMG